jgi:hypothetical protein
MQQRLFLPLALLCCVAQSQAAFGAAHDTNGPVTLNTPRDFPSISSAEQWQARAKEIREQVLVSAGLWPLPEKTPLLTRTFGKIQRDGYSIEKVYFQTFPGFYLAGNLYRPSGKGDGPFPGILNPHGHWKEGRMADSKDGSNAARCISFARQGMIAFAYDMVGYNDTFFAGSPTNPPSYERHRQFGTNRSDLLWGISLMGLQTWNSIRALDFLESLPEVDKKRLACTGESGGGTQTFILGAVDDRLAAQAPVVMVSHTMQGGCSCENMAGLRVEYSNMEIAAAPAPRPQLLVSATGDWTKDTPTVEGPSIEHIYQLLKAPEKFHYVRFDFGHNYNQTSREAVYQWFDKWLLKSNDANTCKEAPYQKEPDSDLLVFPDGKLPDRAMTMEQFNESLMKMSEQRWQSLVPKKKAGLQEFREVMLPAWRHTLQVDWPQNVDKVKVGDLKQSGGIFADLKTTRNGEEILLGSYFPAPEISTSGAPKLVVLVNENSFRSAGQTLRPAPLLGSLLQRGVSVILITDYVFREPPDQFANFYTTYNRTLVQQRVRDVLAVCQAARSLDSGKQIPYQVILAGSGRAGLAALLAAPAADAVIADCNQLDVSSDDALLANDLLCPGIRNIGTFDGAPMLAAPHPLLLHNTGSKFGTGDLRATYKAATASDKVRIASNSLSDNDLISWIANLK